MEIHDGLQNNEEEIRSFLLIGQSNMAGRGDFGEVDPIDNRSCFMLRMGRWQPMSEPINVDRDILNIKFHSGISLGASFADEMAKEAEFFSFGTNDLTQMTFGFSRDDIGSFLPEYMENRILDSDPFQTIDVNGVGRLIEYAVKNGRATRSDLKIGICGEQGGEGKSVMFCHKAGLNYVSCSPFRVPVARLAAAQAAIADLQNK